MLKTCFYEKRSTLLMSTTMILFWIALVLFCQANSPLFDLESMLRVRFSESRSDAFEFVNSLVAPPCSSIFASWLFGLMWASRHKRYRGASALALSPLLSAILAAATLNWQDPAWYQSGAIVCIGCFVGLVVAVAWESIVFRSPVGKSH